MSKSLVKKQGALQKGALTQLAKRYLSESLSLSTRKAYLKDLQIFDLWCQMRGSLSLPATPEIVANFISDQASGILTELITLNKGKSWKLQNGLKIKPATLNRRLAAIRFIHQRKGFDLGPTDSQKVRGVLKGIKRKEGVKVGRKKAATSNLILQMVGEIPSDLLGMRDKALLLLGFSGAFRRSELVNLNFEDLEFRDQGLLVHIRRSKTDQEGKGTLKAIVPGNLDCPIKAIKSYLKDSGIESGALFRKGHKSGTLTEHRLSAQSVSLLLKKYAHLCGLNANEFAGHSLRRGFLTSAAREGKNIFKMMEVSGHQSIEMMRVYYEVQEMFEDHAGEGLL